MSSKYKIPRHGISQDVLQHQLKKYFDHDAQLVTVTDDLVSKSATAASRRLMSIVCRKICKATTLCIARAATGLSSEVLTGQSGHSRRH